jgi:DNA-binding transcriptional LysR family regulator
MELGQIEAFLSVARTASFTRAGHELPLSQPALSRRIGALEGRLGVALFERGRHGARLTEAGVRLRPFAEAIVAATRAGAIAARRPPEPPANTITIGLVSSMLSTPLASALAEFRADHRRLRVHIRTATSDGVSALVRQGEARMGLRFFGDPDPALVCRPIRDEALCVVGARGHRLAGQRRASTAALGREAWIALDPAILRRNLATLGIDGADYVLVDSLETQKGLIEAGFGIGVLLAASVAPELRAGRFRVLRSRWSRGVLPIVSVTRHDEPGRGVPERFVARLTGRP